MREWSTGPYGEQEARKGPYVLFKHDGKEWHTDPWCWEVYGDRCEYVGKGYAQFRFTALYQARRALKYHRKQEARRARPEEIVPL